MDRPAWQRNVAMAPMTTLGVGGPARWYVECRTAADVVAALARCRDEGLDLFVLGGGSNLLVADRGFGGVVLRVRDESFQAQVDGTTIRVRAGAGHGWDRLVRRCVREDWAGLECLSGIPGQVGAAPMQNIGAYGQELAPVVHQVRALRVRDGEVIELDRQACGFGYRTSVFKRREIEPVVICEVSFLLQAGGEPILRYPELSAEVVARCGSSPPSLPLVREAVLAVRRRKSMVLDPDDPNSRSAGSFFLNPVVDDATADAIRARVGSTLAMPRYEAGPGRSKLSAAWLIEQAGFRRGHARGRAGLSERHVLAVVNRGGATAKDLLELAVEVRQGVARQFGVRLTPEPNLVGFAPEEIANLLD